MKKHLKWMIPVAAVLIAAAAVAVFFLTKKTTEPEKAAEIKIAWNVDREKYYNEESGTSTRMKNKDMYRATFAVDGVQQDYFFQSSAMIDKADSEEVCGLLCDENNIVSAVYDVEECVGGYSSYECYIESFTDTEIKLNTVANFRGLPFVAKVNENTKYYFADKDGGPLVGTEAKPEVGAEVISVQNTRGITTHVYILPPFEKTDVYWNVKRMWNSTTGFSTRMPNELGIYEIIFAVGGEQVTLKARNSDVVDNIDSIGAKCMHLEFDEEGYITEVAKASESTGGPSKASWYYVSEIDENNLDGVDFVATRTVDGVLKTAKCFKSSDCKIYDVSDTAAVCGQVGELAVGDRIHCLTDPSGDVCIVYIINKCMHKDIYWNVERKYNSEEKASTREKASDGYYYFTLATDGKQVTLRTKDKTIVDNMDSRAAKCFGLDVENGIIKAYYPPAELWGGVTFASWSDVTEYSDGVIVADKSENGEIIETYQATCADDCVFYDVSGSGRFVGEKTTLKVGDRIHGLMDVNNKVHTVFIVGREFKSEIYFNINRQWNSTTKESKRTPAADGYYYIDFAVNGKQVTYKTNEKELADKIDSFGVMCMGLQLKGDVITSAVSTKSVSGYRGGTTAAWCDVTKVSGTNVTVKKNIKTDADYGKVYTKEIPKSAKIYNCSSGYSKYFGEPTTVQVGDRIHCLVSEKGQIAVVFVVSRTVDAPIYWNTERQWDSKTSKSTRTADKDGWYHFTMVCDGKTSQLKTKDTSVAEFIDGRAASCFGLILDGNEIVRALRPDSCAATKGPTFASWAKITKISGTKLTASDGKETYTGIMAKNCKIFDVSGKGSYIGEPTTALEEGYQIHGITNASGEIVILYIISRPYDLPIYWNVTRMWKDGASTRTADKDGWYRFTMAIDGKQVELKTKDTAIVKTIDERAAKCFGLEVQGDVIVQAVRPDACSKTIGATYASWCIVTKVDGKTVTATESGKSVSATMASDCKIFDVSGTGASVGKQVSTVMKGYRIHGLTNSKGEIVILYLIDTAGGEPEPVAHTQNHCICGGNATASHGTCTTVTQWTALTASQLAEGKDGYLHFKSSGSYYLGFDYDLKSKTLYVEPGQTVTLCLNGFKLTGSNRVFRNVGTLNICDHTGSGEVYSTSTGSGAILYNYSGSELNLFGGLLHVSEANRGYGAIAVSDDTLGTVTEKVGSTMNMYGGTVVGCKAITNGGGTLWVLNGAKLNLYGGTVTGGSASDTVKGGNIFVSGSAMTMTGGTVTGGNAKLGGGIYVSSGSTLTVSGDATVTGNTGSNIYLEGTLALGSGGLGETARLGITVTKIGALLKNLTKDISSNFTCDSAKQALRYESGTLYAEELHQPCVCGGNITVSHGTCNAATKWTAAASAADITAMTKQATQNTEGRTFNGNTVNIYLTADITMTGPFEVIPDQTVNLCLNGHTLTAASGKRLARVYGGTLNICDCTGKGKMLTRNAYGINLYAKATCNFYGGTVGYYEDKSGKHGLIYVGDDEGYGLTKGGVAVFNQYGGTVDATKFTVTDSGGAVWVFSASKYNLYAGTVIGGTVSGSGKGSAMSATNTATITLNGGTVQGDIYKASTATVNDNRPK